MVFESRKDTTLFVEKATLVSSEEAMLIRRRVQFIPAKQQFRA
jgi:hypothetical protein